MTESQHDRRQLFIGVAGAGALAVLDPLRALAPNGVQLGVQSYSFRSFTFEEALEAARAIGLHWIEPYRGHLAADAESFSEAKALLDRLEMGLSSYGVVGFDEDARKSRRVFELVKRQSVSVVSANPTRDSLSVLEGLCSEYAVSIGIHNHGHGHRYVGLGDLESAVAGRNRWIGVCLDTGHALRTGEDPARMARRLGSRVHGVHLKDWIAGGDEQVLGRGDLDVEDFAAALREIGFSGPISIEYELEAHDPAPGVSAGLDRWRQATSAR